MGYQNQAWLDQWREPVIDPDQLICDPHHHLWDTPTNYTSSSGTKAKIPSYLLQHLLADVGSG